MTDAAPMDEAALRRFKDAWRSGRPATAEPFLPPRRQPTYLGAVAGLACRGGYRGRGTVGAGGSGAGDKGYGGGLGRPVARKAPHRSRLSRPGHAALSLAEARVLAGLDHQHIVPVYDVGSTADGLCFV